VATDWDRLFDELYLRTYAQLADPETGPRQAEGVARLVGLEPGADLLDCPCGYGRHSIEFARLGFHVVGADRSEVLLAEAKRQAGEDEWPRFVQSDYRELPFEDASFDSVVVGFGVRNVEDLEAGLRELRRVLHSGGRLGILEITKPRGPLALFYKLWFDRIVPLLGRVLPGGAAYTYLPASVRRFPGPEQLAELLGTCGFGGVEFRRFAGGIVALHVGEAM